MADELRWETLLVDVADGVTASDAGATFTNTTKDDIFIRRIHRALRTAAAGPNEIMTSQLSKQGSFQSINGQSGFNLTDEVGTPASGATPTDGTTTFNATELYARGQLKLEPNETVFVNVTKSSGGASRSRYEIGYHF